jgi:TolB-like protein/class 3 adenylate cyclase
MRRAETTNPGALPLSTKHVERRLTAVLAADVVGYSRLLGADEEGTLARLKALRIGLVDPAISSHRGRIVKTTGDGMLVEFASAVDAIRGAVVIQRSVAEQNTAVASDQRIEFRIGIHVGDIIFDDNDIFGDGVNIAARLENIAESGGICISDDAQRQVRGKVDVTFGDMGPQVLKNIAEPMRSWRVLMDGNTSSTRLEKRPSEPATPVLNDKPSIAVLPFQNMSGDPEQEYFADGMVEEIITALSRFKALFVLSRNSSFTYKGNAVDIPKVGRELGVRYVLEGSVRKAGGTVRITGQLIDAVSDTHLWADRFDGAMDDVFALQDKVTMSVVAAIAPKIEQVEIDRSKARPTSNLVAYDHILRGLCSYYQLTKAANENAMRSFAKANELHPNSAYPLGWLAACYVQRAQQGWWIDPRAEAVEGARLARISLGLATDDALVLAGNAFALALLAGDLDAARTFVDRSLLLNPNLDTGWLCSGWIRLLRGEHETAIDHFLKALQFSPFGPLNYHMMSGLAFSYFFEDKNADACFWAEKAADERPDNLPGLKILASAYACAEKQQDAQKITSRILTLRPATTIGFTVKSTFLRREIDRVRYENGLRLAGLPE